MTNFCEFPGAKTVLQKITALLYWIIIAVAEHFANSAI